MNSPLLEVNNLFFYTFPVRWCCYVSTCFEQASVLTRDILFYSIFVKLQQYYCYLGKQSKREYLQNPSLQNSLFLVGKLEGIIPIPEPWQIWMWIILI